MLELEARAACNSGFGKVKERIGEKGFWGEVYDRERIICSFTELNDAAISLLEGIIKNMKLEVVRAWET